MQTTHSVAYTQYGDGKEVRFDGYMRENETEKVAVVWTCKKGEV